MADETDVRRLLLPKTLAMLERYAPGTYVPDGERCYDDDEIAEFGTALARLVYAPSQIRKRLEELGATVTRSDFYSEVPTIADLEASAARQPRRFDACFDDPDGMRALISELMPYAHEFAPEALRSPVPVRWDDQQFGYSDLAAYYAMIRRYRPRTIVELGCGTSTRVAALACERNGRGRIAAVDPYPAASLSDLPGVTVHRAAAQDLTGGFFDDMLADGDFVFIDTTHAVKHDSDCVHIYLRLLPAIRKDVFVHVHDVFLPGPLPMHFMRDAQVFWTEQYLLYAYLLENPRTRTLWGSAYHQVHNADLLGRFMNGRARAGGASFWFHQSKRPSSGATGA